MKALAALALVLFVIAPPAFAEAGPAAAAEPPVDIDAGGFFVLPKGDAVAPAYRGAVVLAAPFPAGGGHIGVVLNRPMSVRLAELFPDHAPSKAVREPIYFGGTYMREGVFALARAKEAPSSMSVALAPGVWLVLDHKSVDQVIEERPNEARYFVGTVSWRAELLAANVAAGAVALAPLTAANAAKIFAPDTSRLAEELFPGELPLAPGARPARLYRMELSR